MACLGWWRGRGERRRSNNFVVIAPLGRRASCHRHTSDRRRAGRAHRHSMRQSWQAKAERGSGRGGERGDRQTWRLQVRMPRQCLGPTSRPGSIGRRETGRPYRGDLVRRGFEEHLRLRAEFLLRSLVDRVPFPDSEVELRNFVDTFQDVDEGQALAMFARAFDGPALRTPFQQESNLHAFQQAIDDTIRVLSTGISRNARRCRNPPTSLVTPHPRCEHPQRSGADGRELDQLRRRLRCCPPEKSGPAAAAIRLGPPSCFPTRRLARWT